MQTGIYAQQLDLFQLFQPKNTINCITKFTFVDLFSGIGGFRIPLEELGGICLGYSEINKEAIKVYRQNFIHNINEEADLGDITNLHQLPFMTDIIVGGVPCQPWSIAGKMQGLQDPRGQLWLDVFRIVKLNQPKAFIFENVKGLTEPRNRESLAYILKNLTSSGYVVKHQVLNSYDFGLPQDRDRIFIVGIRNDIDNCWGFSFPQKINKRPKLYDLIPGVEKSNLLKKKFPPEVLFTDGKIPASRGRFQKIDELNDFFTFADIRDGHTTIHSWELIETNHREKLICQTILKNRRKKIYGEKDGNPLGFEILQCLIPRLEIEEINTLVEKQILCFIEGKGYEFVNSKISSGIKGICKIFLPHADAIGTLTATGTRDYVATISIECEAPDLYKQKFIRQIYNQNKYKPLTAQDYARLQGFPENFQIAENETTAKHQLGNAVSVPVVYHLANALLKIIL
ncbi:DNA cytosine methyltransferase [Nodularia sp. UHCC 0506]|uniref:DNA cytosine methyltransferase n=1 Tax=Nodularia sp. UHCC 0506 TaxID=3110243 RepID=UPI002B21D26B|nr:DNA cytosine methyltransferase [Nodularia sp. UHCC 0506]MEA5512496.1 DNA cytosine methyltransferase [Nodularia sp. UHCC 0506]